MGWDVYAKVKDVDGHEHEVGEWGCTYNVSPMLRGAGLEMPEWTQEWIEKADSKTIASRLGDTIATLEADPGKFKAMNPSNGWGSYDGLLETLKDIHRVALEYPSATWSAWF